MMAMLCMFAAFPAVEADAATVTVNGGCTTRATAYNWGSYSITNSILVVLPESEDDFWAKFTLPRDKQIYIRCSYSTENEGMYIETRSETRLLDEKFSPEDVLDADTILPFMAVNCDNLTSSTQTFYVHANRGTAAGTLYFTLSMNERIKSGRGTFSFSGTASNPGNSSINPAGVDSSVLSLNLTRNTDIPPAAIVKRVSTSGTQSPRQGNVHHMIMPATQPSIWYTSIYTDNASGDYNIDTSDDIEVRQIWQFKYNAMSTAKSTMSRVTLKFEWEYDIANTGYKTY